MKKILINAIFFALISSSPVNAEVSEKQSISKNYERLKIIFNAREELQNRKFDRLDIKKIVLPKITSMKRSYECSGSGNIKVLGSNSPDIPMEVITNQEMPLGLNITHTENNVSASMQMPEASGISGKLEMTMDKKDPSLSFFRLGNHTVSLADASLPPELRQLFKKHMKNFYERNEIKVGSNLDEDLESDLNALIVMLLSSHSEFREKNRDVFDYSSETVSFGEYQSSISGTLFAYNLKDSVAIEIEGENFSMQFIQLSDNLLHVPTGAPLQGSQLEYTLVESREGVMVSEQYTDMNCFLDAPEQLPDTISNQLKEALK